MLNQEQFQAKWPEIRAGLRNIWGKLTNEELDDIKNNIWEITELVERKHGDTKADIRFKLHRLMDSFDNDTDKNISPDTTSYQRSPYGDPTRENINMLASEGVTIDQSPYTPDRTEVENLKNPRTIFLTDN